MFADESHRLVAEQDGCVAFIAADLVVAVPIEAAVANVGEVIESAVVVAILVIEAAGGRQIIARWKCNRGAICR